MSQKYFLAFSLIVLLSLAFLPPTILASSSTAIGQKAGGYQYTFSVEEGQFIWKISHHESTTILVENSTNKASLFSFKEAVDTIYSKTATLTITIFYTLIVIICLFIARNKGLPFALPYKMFYLSLLLIMVYIITTNAADLNSGYTDAAIYFPQLQD